MIVAGSCAGTNDSELPDAVARVVPAKLSNAQAWRLFDRSVSDGFTPDEQPVEIDFDRLEKIVAFKVHGPAPYLLDLRGAHGASLGFGAINLSTLTPGWQTIRTETPSATSHVELRFRSLGEAKPIPELELWAADDLEPSPGSVPATPNRTLSFAARDKTKELEPGDCGTLVVDLDRPPSVFRRIDLVYESTGALRGFSLERSVNGRGAIGGAWIAGNTSKARSFTEQLDPADLQLGHNEIRICVPSSANRLVTVNDLRLVGEPDRGNRLPVRATLEGGTDAAAILDDDTNTTSTIGAGQRILLDFDRLIAPDALVVLGDALPARVDCIAANGTALPIPIVDLGDTLRLDGGTKACRGLAATFASAATLSSLDVLGSGAEEAVDWPHLVITSTPEHFGKQAWIGGYVARPRQMAGAIRVAVAGAAVERKTGAFGRLISRTSGTGAWTVDVTATYPDGTQDIRKIALDIDRAADLVASPQSTGAAATDPNEKRYGKAGASAAADARRDVATSIRLGTRVGIDVPVGAVTHPTTIMANHLDHAGLPPLDPGMINVTAPKGHGYEFLPHGQHFAKAVEVTVPFDTTLIPRDMSVDDVYTYYYDTKARHWKKLNRKSIDLGDHTTRSLTNHFTIMIDAVLTVPTNPQPLAFDPTMVSSVAAASPAANMDFIEPPTANPMGDARVSLPVRLPPGRGKYSPALSLTYSSSSGNSWTGTGWDLAVSKIEIDTRWGVPTYAPTEEPRYLLDGAEIVPTLDTDGPTCTNGRRYHARIEGAFTHILRCGADPASYYWELRDRNGTKYVYGGDTTSVLASYRAPFGIFRWNLREVTDVHQNRTTYLYHVDNILGGPSGSEAARETYLDSIVYTVHTSLPARYSVELVRDDGTRADRIISGRPGFKEVTRHLLRTIRVKFDTSTIREYVLTYAHGQFGKTVLSTVRLYGEGGCAAGLDAFTAPSCNGSAFFDEHSFTYFDGIDDADGVDVPEAFGPPTTWSVLDDPDPTHAALAKGYSETSSASVSLSAKRGGFGASAGASGTTGERWEMVGVYDINGDGLPDQVMDNSAVLYNQSNSGPNNHSFSSQGPTVSGVFRFGSHEVQNGWSVDAKAGVDVKGFGASASGGYSNSKSSADIIYTDLDGDGFLDRSGGYTLFSAPCETGHCFTVGAPFEAAGLVDPKLDPVLAETESEVSERLVRGDPVVRWIAPYSGTATISGFAQKVRAGGIDGVTVELYGQQVGASPAEDTLLGQTTIPAGSTDYNFIMPGSIPVTAGQAFYLRVRTGDQGIDPDGTVNDEIVTSISAAYSEVCVGGTCSPANASSFDTDPTNRNIYMFSSSQDGRINGVKPFAIAANGSIRVRGQIVKPIRSAARLRVCLQRFPQDSEQFDLPCGSAGTTTLAGPYSFAEGLTTTQLLDVTAAVNVGEFLVLRVEADFSFDPGGLKFQPINTSTPLVEYTQVCLPDGSPCSTDPSVLAKVPVDTSTFGPFAAQVSPPYPIGAPPRPLVAQWGGGTWQVAAFNNPLYPRPITVTLRSNTRGTLGSFNCTSFCGIRNKFGNTPPIGPIAVKSFESVTFEIVADSVDGAPYGFTIPGAYGYSGSAAPTVFRNRAAPLPAERTPFVGGYRGFSFSFWNENLQGCEAENDGDFQPSRLLEDYSIAESDPDSFSECRLKQMTKSAIEPVSYFNTPVVYPLTDPEPAWSGPGSAAFITPSGHANAADIGVMQTGSPSAASSVFGGSYARLSCTRSYYLGASLQAVDIASLNATVSNSDTATTTDVLDLTGDGIADVVAGDRILVSTLIPGNVRTLDTPEISDALHDGFRRRTSHDYSIGFGSTASFPITTSGGRRRNMDAQDIPEHDGGFSTSEGISVGRSQTTQDLQDLNGDGLPDIVKRDQVLVGTETVDAILVRYNLGDRFDGWEYFATVDPSLGGASIDSFETFEDSTSVAGVSLQSNQQALSHETTITQNITYTLELLFASASYSIKTTSSRTTRQLIDLNGDGMPDLLLKKADEPFIHVQYNLGGTFTAATTWQAPAWGGEVFPSFSTAYGDLFSGTNAVTGPDVLASTGTQDSTAYSGSVSIPIASVLSAGVSGSSASEKDTYELGLIDLDGDGAPEHVLRRGESNDPQYMYVKPNLATGKSNLLKTITRPLGGSIKLDYFRPKNTVDNPHPQMTLASVEIDDASPAQLDARYGSPNIAMIYAYEGGHYDRLEKQFMGYHQILSYRSDGQITERTYDNESFALHGSLLEETRKTEEGGELLYHHVISYEARDVLDDNGFGVVPHPDCFDNRHALLRRLGTEPCMPRYFVAWRDEETRFEGAQSKTRTIQDTLWDRFGNVLESLDGGDPALTSDDLYSTVQYANDTTQWILGRPSTLTVRAGSAGGTLLRSRFGLYNAEGDLRVIGIDPTGLDEAWAQTSLTYDDFGNLQSITTPPNEAGQVQAYMLTFDPDVATYPIRTEDAFGYASTAVYDLRYGIATSETDVSGATVTRTLDPFGRLASVRGPYDTAQDALTMDYFQLESPPRAVTTTRTSAPPDFTGTLAPPFTTVTVTDGLGRPIELRKTAVVDVAGTATTGMTTSGLMERDALGRTTRTYQPFFTAGVSTAFVVPATTPLYVSTGYDTHDRPTSTTYPDGAVETVGYSIETTTPVPGSPTLFRTQTIDADGNQRQAFIDQLGRTRAFVEHPSSTESSTSTYDYLATGELISIQDAEGNATTLGYDLRGLRTSLHNPDTGLITDRYDLMGNRIATQEPNHRALGAEVEVHFGYNRNRLETVVYPSKPSIRTCASGASASVCYEYGASTASDPNARGRLVKVQDESGFQEHTYGAMGELRATIRTVQPPGLSPVVFDHRYTFDSLGRQLSIRYPDGELVENSFDDGGNLSAITGHGNGWDRTYASDIQYDMFGNRTQLRYGNNVLSTWSYDPNRVRLSGLTTTLPTGTNIQSLSYAYTQNNLGNNLAAITNNLAAIDNQSPSNYPGPSTLSFRYDGVDRLTAAHGEAQYDAQKTTTYDQTFAYSPSHNLLSKRRVHRLFQSLTTNYTYDPKTQIDRCSNPPCNPASYLYQTQWDAACGESLSVRPHLPSQFGDSQEGILFAYDCSGNPTERHKQDTGSVQLLTWDDDGRLTDSDEAGASQHNTYDAGGRRVRRASSGGGQNNVTIFSSAYFDLEGNTQGIKHIFAGELRVASELSTFASGAEPSPPAAPGDAYYFHVDHLGSPTVLTDQTGVVYESTEYFVDGEEWIDHGPTSSLNEYLFNGKPFDKDTGFYDYGQRFYDPRTSLWLGIDAAFTDSPNVAIGHSTYLSLIGFSAQNPVRFSDPDGRGFWDRVKHYAVGFAKTATYPIVHPIKTYEGTKSFVRAAGTMVGEGYAKAYIAMFGTEQQKEYVRNDQPLAGAKDRVEQYLLTTPENQVMEDFGGLIGALLGPEVIGKAASSANRMVTATRAAAAAEEGYAGVGAMRRLEYEANPKHGSAPRGRASPAPTNGQAALDNSIPFSDNSTRRVGIDYSTNEFVVFAQHLPGQFHGWVEAWSDLTQPMQAELRRWGMADKKGNILKD